ncbi:MAG: class I SAM-dependent methyltransferase, partial [Candidatus Eisenbacteria bacterium]
MTPESPRPAAPARASVDGQTGRQREAVRAFYDEVGWHAAADAEGFEDGRRFDEVNPATAVYVRDCHRRVGEVLEREGNLFLDAASGPVQFREYLEYSRGFRHRVCVDLSLRALRAARERLGAHALCVQADVARLPFRPGSFRAGVSLSTIYHVPADDQAAAFCELDRVAAPGGRIAVAYSWGKFSALMLLPDALPAKLASLFRRRGNGAGEPELYFHPRSPWWFRREVA